MKTILEFSHSLTDNYGLSIIILSIIVNIILLPLYYMAEKWKAKDKAVQDSMKPEIDNIKKHYKGQERHFYIQTIYRRYRYHPVSSIKASVGFLIQIPFFFAAFHLLSNYQALNGVSFGILKDLGSPDHLIAGINVLPIVMTVVNLLSAYIYIELLNKSEKIQLFALAFIFLVVLYSEPAGLLLYWTMNNVFSLMKNIVEKKFKLGPLFSRTFKKEKIDISFIKKLPLVEIIISIIVLYLYLLGIQKLTPDGITHIFSIRFHKTLLYILVFLVLLIAFNSYIVKRMGKYKISLIENKKWSDFLLILLPLTPIVQYIIINHDILTLFGIIYILSLTSLVSIIIVISIPIILSPFVSRYIMISIGLSLISLLFFMPTLSAIFLWHDVGSLKIQLALFSFLFIIIALLLKFQRKLFGTIILVLFLINTMVISFPMVKNIFLNSKPPLKVENILPNPKQPLKSDKNTQSNLKLLSKPDIYLLIYDAYPARETMKFYDINNTRQMDYLNDLNFKIYDGIYSIGENSLGAISTLLNISDVVNSRTNSRRVISGENFVNKYLQENGYITASILSNTYMMGQNKPTYNVFEPKTVDTQKHKLLLKSILLGEFSAKLETEIVSNPKYKEVQKSFITLKKHPKFVYMHSEDPHHSAYGKKCKKNEFQLFEKRLKRANQEMKNDIEIIEKNNPGSIIIIAGDHGPYITGNCTMKKGFVEKKEDVKRINVQDSFGVFLAIKWPENIEVYDDNIIVLQDIFPSILATLSANSDTFKKLQVRSKTIDTKGSLAGAYVENGIIHGGKNDGESLFLDTK